jgi:hypothetical protein
MEEPMTSNQIEEIWTSVSNYLPERVKLDCAVDYVKTLLDMDTDPAVIKAAGEYDEKLEQAISTVLAEEGLDEEEEDYYGEQ